MSKLINETMLVRLNSSTHTGTMLGVFLDLQKSETMVDVTLSAEGQFIQAHRVILAASSLYFKDLLCHLQQQQQHQRYPVIWLKDIQFKQLEWLVKYMYTGQVDIPQNELHSLIKTASELKVVGLSTTSVPPVDSNNDNEEEEEEEGNNIASETAISPQEEEETFDFDDNEDDNDDEEMNDEESLLEQDETIIKLEPSDDEPKATNSKSTRSTTKQNSSKEMMVSRLNDNEINNLPVNQNHLQCSKCGKKYTSSKSLWRHKKFACEGKHSFICQICNKIFSRSDNLRRHSLVAHSII